MPTTAIAVTFSRARVKILTAGAVVTAAVMAATVAASAFQEVDTRPADPLMTVAAGQGVELTLTNMGAQPCAAEAGFADASGRSIGPLSAVRVAPGQVATIDNPDLRPADGRTALVHGVVRADSACSLLGGTSVLDGDGTTRSVSALWLGGSRPSGPTFAPVGGIGGQSLRVSVVNAGRSPCTARLSVAGLDGTVLNASSATVSPGASAWLDQGFQEVENRPSPRTSLLPAVHAASGDCHLLAGVQVIDDASGAAVATAQGIGDTESVAGAPATNSGRTAGGQ